ncbi:MAG: UDP-2,3-diacylglucosamine diphosphatase [Granulosicoccus sp.]
MTQSLFVADLHLDPANPDTINLAIEFLVEAKSADQLYILGDLFEYWLGDDAGDPALSPIIDALTLLSASSTQLYLMHGNRDFLLGDAFATQIGATLISDDEHIVQLGDERILLLHGDTLCTDDVDYQKLRSQLRAPEWQKRFLAMSIEQRVTTAQALRQKSRNAVAGKQAAIMDVNEEAVHSRFLATACPIMLHGHTHRPDTHQVDVNGQTRQRLVVGSWHSDHAVYARYDGQQLQLQTYTLSRKYSSRDTA